ncbi:MAG: hypothetical protein ACHQRM_07400 [Bacteroidia bacterium]
MSELNKINYLNIGLMLLSCGIAFYLPFDLFLFAYAVLGPAHYLTEISWLHERNYFTKGKRDYILLVLLAIVIFLCGYVFRYMKVFQAKNLWYSLANTTIYIAFLSALVLVLIKESFPRIIGIILVCISALLASNYTTFFSVFLPTLIHVYVFTGLFILYGALKSRSRSGYLSFLVFLICPFLFVVVDSSNFMLSGYAHKTYDYFKAVNLEVYGRFFRREDNTVLDQGSVVYQSLIGIKIMRFIAFAYTYHYLNWFSKTTVIKWHKISKIRMGVIALIWLISIGLYRYDYKLGFDWLFLLSFMHVFLEFPLNHTSFIGIFRETKNILAGKPAS